MSGAEELYRLLADHHPTTGMSVASGVTCRCGYWTGEEEPGRTRPVGVRGDQLDWHRTQVLVLGGYATFTPERIAKVVERTGLSLQTVAEVARELRQA